MSYHITLARAESGRGITADEWRNFVVNRPELKIVDENARFITAILHGRDQLALHYSMGSASVFTENPEGPQIIEYMASIAPYFDAVVTGDEGENYLSSADWGSQEDWNTPPSRRAFWQQELTTGNIIRMAILALLVSALIYKHFIARH